MPKKYLFLFALSLLISLMISILGGFGGHHIRFLVAAIVYFILTYYLFRKTNSSNDRMGVTLSIFLAPAVLFLPIHITEFESTKLSLPSTLAHFIGIAFGVLAYFSGRFIRGGLAVLLLAGSLWMTFQGYSYWLHKLNFGTFDGRVYYRSVVPIKGKNQYGGIVTEEKLKNKTLLVDFWFTKCSLCFKEFPDLQKLYEKYQSDSSIVFLAVNKPIESDTTGEAFHVIEKTGYTFPVLIPENDDLPELFGVLAYPTTFIINPSGNVVFRGDLKFAIPVLEKELVK